MTNNENIFRTSLIVSGVWLILHTNTEVLVMCEVTYKMEVKYCGTATKAWNHEGRQHPDNYSDSPL